MYEFKRVAMTSSVMKILEGLVLINLQDKLVNFVALLQFADRKNGSVDDDWCYSFLFEQCLWTPSTFWKVCYNYFFIQYNHIWFPIILLKIDINENNISLMDSTLPNQQTAVYYIM